MRAVVRGAGELLLSLGAVILLFLAYLIWGSAWRASSAQHQLAGALNGQRPAPACAYGVHAPAGPGLIHLVTGRPFAIIRIPAFGPRWQFTLVQGTSLAQLNVSPGHVPGTQLPGQLGNFAVAAHRVTAGNPFWGLPSLKDGDLVYIDTKASTYTYKVIGKQQVLPDDTAVLDPVPGHPGHRAAQRLITLITCNPPWTGTHRIIVTGILVPATARTCAPGPGVAAG